MEGRFGCLACHIYVLTPPPESTQLSCTMADQGIKIRIRKDIRTRRRTLVPAPPQPIGPIETSPTIGRASQKAEDGPKVKKGSGLRVVREVKRQKIERIGEIVPDAHDNVVESRNPSSCPSLAYSNTHVFRPADPS
jgi:hypothetical protein